jgi:hypothetical protein
MPTGYRLCDFWQERVKILPVALLAEDVLQLSGRLLAHLYLTEAGTRAKPDKGCEYRKAHPNPALGTARVSSHPMTLDSYFVLHSLSDLDWA